jgi:hypothetical protein
MAMTARPAADITVGLEDERGSKSSMNLNIDYATLAAVGIAGIDLLIPTIAAISGCAITGYSLSYSKFDPTPGAPAVDSRVEYVGQFQLLTSAGKIVTYSVPGFDPTLVDATGVIDEDQIAVAAFLTELLTVPGIWTDSNGQSLDQLIRAYQIGRKTGKRQAPKKRRPD